MVDISRGYIHRNDDLFNSLLGIYRDVGCTAWTRCQDCPFHTCLFDMKQGVSFQARRALMVVLRHARGETFAQIAASLDMSEKRAVRYYNEAELHLWSRDDVEEKVRNGTAHDPDTIRTSCSN